MKKAFILVAFCLSILVAQAQTVYSFEEAKKIALATNKLIVIDFWASWCGPCKRMESVVWNSDQIKPITENFVFAKINFNENKELASKYGVKAIPNILITDGNGEVLKQNIGYMELNSTISFLRDYQLNTEFLAVESIAFYKNTNYLSATRLGLKNFEYTLFLEKNEANNFINIAISYLNQAEKLLDKKSDTYKDNKQLLEILKLSKYAYKNDYYRLEKKISNYTLNEISLNTGKSYFQLYEYLIALNKNKAEEYNKTITSDEFTFFKNKADKIFEKHNK